MPCSGHYPPPVPGISEIFLVDVVLVVAVFVVVGDRIQMRDRPIVTTSGIGHVPGLVRHPAGNDVVLVRGGIARRSRAPPR